MARYLYNGSVEYSVDVRALRQLTNPHRSSLCEDGVARGGEERNVLARTSVRIVVKTVDLREVVCPVLGGGLEAIIPLQWCDANCGAS